MQKTLSIVARLLLAVLVVLALTLGLFRWMAAQREVVQFGQNLPSDGLMVQTRAGRFFLLEAGKPGRPQVLFAHGTAAWSGLWRPTLKAVAAVDYHAVAFDMPPFGWSQYPARPDYSRGVQALRLIALLEALGTKPIVVAHSVGAGPVAEAVMLRPDLVSGLVVVDGAIALNSHETPKSLPLPLRHAGLRELVASGTISNPYLTGWFLKQFIALDEAATPERVALLQEPMQRAGYTRAVSQWLPELLVPPVDALSTRPEAWQNMTVPLALIWGTADDVTPPEQAREIAALSRRAKLFMIKDVGHIPQIEAPEAFEKVLIEALQSLVP